jgi:hypothetical protein
MRRGTSWLPNTHIESDGLPFGYAPGQPAAHVLCIGKVSIMTFTRMIAT